MPSAKPRPKSHTYYHKDGSIYGKGQLLGSVMTGNWEWYRKDGSLMRSGSFDNGVQVGEWKTYDRNGRVVKVTRMKAKKS